MMYAHSALYTPARMVTMMPLTCVSGYANMACMWILSVEGILMMLARSWAK